MTTAQTAALVIALAAVESSQIHAIGFDGTNTLAIQFKNKKGPSSVYHYDLSKIEDPAAFYAEFQAAESKGRFFGQRIKNNPEIPFRKIEPEQPQDQALADQPAEAA
jgi:hypothetical protein